MSENAPVYKRIHVIVNPAAGQDRPILGTLNRVFHAAGVDWDVFVTKKAGDAERLAREAVEVGAEAVGVYGGDGTVMEVASGLMGSDVPLGIFPGGTANVMSVELGIPSDLAEATALVCGEAAEVRHIDVGEVNGRRFVLRVGLGFEAEMVEGADRDLKDKIGVLAYGLSAMRALASPKIACYRLTIDERTFEAHGMTCIIANTGSLGQLGVSLAPNIDVSDGLLDVVIVREANIPSLLGLATSIVRGDQESDDLLHWQAREVTIEADPPQVVQADGEVLDEQGPITARVLPGAIKVIVPKAAEQRHINPEAHAAASDGRLSA